MTIKADRIPSPYDALADRVGGPDASFFLTLIPVDQLRLIAELGDDSVMELRGSREGL